MLHALTEEHARLRKLVEMLHDTLCPADSEAFPQHGSHICGVQLMGGQEQTEFWYKQCCDALGLNTQTAPAFHNGIPESYVCFTVTDDGA